MRAASAGGAGDAFRCGKGWACCALVPAPFMERHSRWPPDLMQWVRTTGPAAAALLAPDGALLRRLLCCWSRLCRCRLCGCRLGAAWLTFSGPGAPPPSARGQRRGTAHCTEVKANDARRLAAKLAHFRCSRASVATTGTMRHSASSQWLSQSAGHPRRRAEARWQVHTSH